MHHIDYISRYALCNRSTNGRKVSPVTHPLICINRQKLKEIQNKKQVKENKQERKYRNK